MSYTIGFHLLRQRLLETYPYGGTKRFLIPNDKVSWATDWPEYTPPLYTSKKVLDHPVWADNDLVAGEGKKSQLKWNSVDGLVNRISYGGPYQLDNDGYPLNPAGRTGIRGRGNLGRWGPNHAADPIITRWNPDSSNILQFVGVQRRDSKEWAIPGGMVDPGEDTYSTCKREFLEEVFSIGDANPKTKTELESTVKLLFENGVDAYKGYVDDPRNTDNAWMETHAINFHFDPKVKYPALPEFRAGSDALNAKWIDISSALKLYASHRHFVQHVAEKHGAWN